MELHQLDTELIRRAFLAGAAELESKKEWINELNVFPVPDGDTGTNMTLTIMTAAKDVAALDEPDLHTLCKAISSGSLRGARGNSGVILSQLLRGLTRGLDSEDQIDVKKIAAAMERATETAYKAVMKPKEGTILTVARSMSEIAGKLVDAQMSMEEYIRSIIEYGNQVLARTPEMLPVLKEAGVVDSGGQGLMVVLEGAFDAFMGKEVEVSVSGAGRTGTVSAVQAEETDIRFGYCTEFIVNLERELPAQQVDDFRSFLMSIGDSIVLVADEELIKVHVHTNDPGVAISRALTYGPLTNMKIDNMRVEHQEKLIKDAERVAREQAEELGLKPAMPQKAMGFVTVCVGEGFRSIFEGLGADYVIEGGQTMNPSTEDMLNAIDQVNAENIFLFPNNKNIIMAANQAKELVREKNIIVIPSVTVPQGIAALISYDAGLSVMENREAMQEAIGTVSTCELTYAIRDTHIGDKEIHQGDIMAVGDDGLLAVGKEIQDTALAGIRAMMTEDAALISIYFGQGYSEENANRLAQAVGELYPDCDVEVNDGGQPVYYCIISVE